MKIRNLWTIATIAFVASSCNATSEDDALVNVFPETTVVQALHNGEALEFIVTADEDATAPFTVTVESLDSGRASLLTTAPRKKRTIQAPTNHSLFSSRAKTTKASIATSSPFYSRPKARSTTSTTISSYAKSFALAPTIRTIPILPQIQIPIPAPTIILPRKPSSASRQRLGSSPPKMARRLLSPSSSANSPNRMSPFLQHPTIHPKASSRRAP